MNDSFWVLVGLAVLGAPIVAIAVIAGLQRDVRRLQGRVDALEARLDRGGAPLSAVPPPDAMVAPLPEPIPFPGPPAAPPPAAAGSGPPEPIATPQLGAAEAPSPPGAAPQPWLTSSRLEDLVGGLWLQNVGSVLVLLGVFFLILWAYTTGRLGPGALVVAGVALGSALVWRGDRTARATPPFGHALIGVGLGIVYLSLYLGHFTLHVLDARVALGLLAAVSLAAVLLGLHYRVQTVALLGVIGAFLPQLLAAAMPLRGMALTPWMLLLYLSAVDAVVLVLAAQAGWGGLSLTALLLTGFTWAAAFGSQMFGWGIRIGQAVQFAAFGLALLPRLVVLPRRVRPIELAVVVLAPLAWLGVAAPFLVRVSATAATLFLLAHALLYLAAAFWVEPRRTDEDLWRPLTGAATLFLTVALALWLGEERAGVGWSTEGVVLLWLGLRSRSGWLRGCGIVVASLGALLLTGEMASSAWRPDQMPVFYTAGVRNLLGLAVLGAGAVILARARPGLSLGEQALSRAWTVMVNVLFLAWSAQEASHLARTLEASGGRWAHAPEFAAPPEHERVRTLSAVFTSATWTLQAGILLAIGWRIGSSFARWLALGLLGLTVLKFLFLDLQRVDAFWRFLTAIVVGAALLAISYAYQRKGRRAAA